MNPGHRVVLILELLHFSGVEVECTILEQCSYRSDKKLCLVNDLHPAPSYFSVWLEDKFLLDKRKELI